MFYLLLLFFFCEWHFKQPQVAIRAKTHSPSYSSPGSLEHSHIYCLIVSTPTHALSVTQEQKHTQTESLQGVICLSTPCRKNKWLRRPYLDVPSLPLFCFVFFSFIRLWLHSNNRCLLVNFAPVLTLGHIPLHSLGKRKSRPRCLVICYPVKHLMDVHLVFLRAVALVQPLASFALPDCNSVLWPPIMRAV